MKIINLDEAIQKIHDTPSRVEKDWEQLDIVCYTLKRRENEIIELLMANAKDPDKKFQEFLDQVVFCHECANKRAVQCRDGIVWRCPHRTNDVDMNGFCESGARMKPEKEDQ